MTDVSAKNETATEFLRRQHEEVRSMFAQLDKLQGDSLIELFDCLRMTLAVHETAEEEVIYPAVRGASDDAAAIVDARLAEEDEAKKTLSELEKIGPGGDAFDPKLKQFQKAVEDHAAAEEREVFPIIERTIDQDKQETMAKALRMAEKMAPTHPHPHSPESALGNMTLGPFVAMADRARDALKDVLNK